MTTYKIVILGNFFMMFHFLMTLRYIRIKQKRRLSQINKLNKLLKIKEHFAIKDFKILHRFKRIHNEIVTLYQEINAHNLFWSKYLTCYFVVYTMEICYLFYGYLFVKMTEIFPQIVFSFFFVEFALLLLYVTLECSRIVTLNNQMHQQCLHTAFLIKQTKLLKIRDQLKLDFIAANSKNIPKICFKLINNYRVNSQMFEMVKTFYIMFKMIN